MDEQQQSAAAEQPVIPTEPTAQSEPSAQLPVEQPKPKKSHKKLFAIVALAVVLLGGGGAAAYFTVFKKDKPATTTNTQTTQTTTDTTEAPKAPSKFFFSFYNGPEPTTIEVYSYDTSSNKKETIANLKGTDRQVAAVVQLKDKVRVFYSISATKGNNTTQSIAYQDDDGPLNIIHSVTSDNTSSDFTSVFMGGAGSVSVDPAGENIDFLEYDAKTAYIKRVTVDKKVTELAKNTADTNTWGISGYKKTALVPKSRSDDGKKVLLEVLNCLQCDGGVVSDLVSLDVVSGKAELVYQNSESKTDGSWRKLSDTSFVVRDTTMSNFGALDYADAADETTTIDVYDTQTKKKVKIFKTTGVDEFDASVLGTSSDKSKVYVVVSKLVKGSKNTEGAYGYTMPVKEIRAYAVKDGTYDVINLGVNFTKERVTFVQGVGKTLIFDTAPAFEENGSTGESTTISVHKLAEGATKSENIATLTGKYAYTQYLGVVDPN